MCGFPLAHLDRHLKRLVQVNKRFAAVCEEFKRRDGTFERRVVRVVTPGTLIDESFVDHFDNNYLMAIATDDEGQRSESTATIGTQGTTVGLAWTDVATGEFYSQDVPVDSLRDEIARIGPREVVLSSRLRDASNSNPIRQALAEEEATVSYIDSTQPSLVPPNAVNGMTTVQQVEQSSSDSDMLQLQQSSSTPSTTNQVFSPNETSAIAILTQFLRSSLLEHMPPDVTAFSPTHQSAEARMQIDAHTIKALEIREGNREGGVTGSLMSVIKRTVTSSGTRLLGRWLCEF